MRLLVIKLYSIALALITLYLGVQASKYGTSSPWFTLFLGTLGPALLLAKLFQFQTLSCRRLVSSISYWQIIWGLVAMLSAIVQKQWLVVWISSEIVAATLVMQFWWRHYVNTNNQELMRLLAQLKPGQYVLLPGLWDPLSLAYLRQKPEVKILIPGSLAQAKPLANKHHLDLDRIEFVAALSNNRDINAARVSVDMQGSVTILESGDFWDRQVLHNKD